jgi:hypothetical protein
MHVLRFGPCLVLSAGLVVAFGSLTASLPAAEQAASAPTFTKNLAPILYKNCTSCHRPGEIGPMSLLTYNEVRPYAKSIRTNVVDRVMPPWFADPQFGKFHNERRLSEADIKTITAWVDSGAPEGNPADLPPAPKYADGWTIKPDVVFEMQTDFAIPADGTIDYKYFDVPTNFTEDKWIQAVEVRPGDRTHVHHAIVYYQEPTQTPRPRVIQVKEDQARVPQPQEGRQGGPGHPLGLTLVAVATGTEAAAYPEGVARRMAAGSNLTFQLHYTTNGTPGSDRSKVGLVFAKKPPQNEMRSFNLINGSFTIPAGAPNHRVDAEVTFTDDVTLWAILPHTHLRGKSFQYQVVYPDGRTETILSVPKYDFTWQTDYAFSPPLKLPKGTRLEATAHYDNSRGNPANPDPTADVKWGDQTWEEMMFSAVRYTVDSAKLPTTTAEKTPGRQ